MSNDDLTRVSAIQLSNDNPDDVLIQEFIVQTAVESLAWFEGLQQVTMFREMDAKQQIAIFASGLLISMIDKIQKDILASVAFTRDDPKALEQITRMVVQKFLDAAIHNHRALGPIRSSEPTH